MASLGLLVKCIAGPKLFRINTYEAEESGRLYDANVLERCGDQVLKTVSWLYSFAVYSSPIIAVVLYRRAFFTFEGLNTGFKFVAIVGILVFTASCLRGVGRWANRDYVSFLADLDRFRGKTNTENKQWLNKYDFDFSAWPPEFIAKNTPTKIIYVDNTSLTKKVLQFPLYITCYIFAHTIGCKMVYPGSLGLLQSAMSSVLMEGRANLIRLGGVRYKLQTQRKHDVEVMFVDRRNKASYPKGNKLIICSEGNAGFYEVGIMATALDVGYSALGWNHPGFGGSTGTPYPYQEQEAIDSVVQFAINKLGYEPNDIILFAWSIGGYTASWAAMTYPDVYAVVLDATFDDLVPLAVAKMPATLAPIVRRTVRDNMNLNIADQICRYPGRVLFIRRTDDEMITTDPTPSLRSNRANHLVVRFLKYRYPKLVIGSSEDVLKNWLMCDRVQKTALWAKFDVQEETCATMLREYFNENSRSFPSNFGENFSADTKSQLVIYMASKYMIDFNSTHCTQLPKQYFHIPWDPSD